MCKNIKQYIPYMLLFIYLIVLYMAVPLFWDDFGYASLAYRPDSITGSQVQGVNWTFSDYVSYCVDMYTGWTGRILFNGIILIPLLRNIYILRILLSLCTVVSIWLLTKLSAENGKNYPVLLSIIGVLLWFAFPIESYSNQWFWYAATSGFVMPIPFFLGTLLLVRDLSKTYRVYVACIFGFITGFSSELISMTICGILFTKLIVDFYNAKYAEAHSKLKKSKSESVSHVDLRYLCVCLSALLGAILLYAAPGNFSRIEMSPHFYTFMELSIIWIHCLFGAESICFTVFLCTFCCLLSWKTYSNRLVRFTMLAWSIMTVAILFIPMADYMTYVVSTSINGISYFLCFMYTCFVFLRNRKSYMNLYLLVFSTLSSLTPVLYSYDILPRMLIQVYLSIFVVALEFISSLDKRSVRIYGAVLASVVCLITVYVSSDLLMGYYGNKEINDYNDTILTEAASDFEKTGIIPEEPVELMALRDYSYAPRRPYPTSIQDYRSYYVLPEGYPIKLPVE